MELNRTRTEGPLTRGSSLDGPTRKGVGKRGGIRGVVEKSVKAKAHLKTPLFRAKSGMLSNLDRHIDLYA